MAHIEFFGDSYQYGHRVLLEELAHLGEWTVHPMMFRRVCKCLGDGCPNEPGGGLDHNNYASFLGLRREQVLPMVQQAEPLTMENLVGDVQGCKYLFLDPDTGIPAGAIRANTSSSRSSVMSSIRGLSCSNSNSRPITEAVVNVSLQRWDSRFKRRPITSRTPSGMRTVQESLSLPVGAGPRRVGAPTILSG